MIEIVIELERLCMLASALNRCPPPSRRNPEAWHVARDYIAREIARSVGRLRKELGIAEPVRRLVPAPEHRSFRHAPARVTGINGAVVPVELRQSRPRTPSPAQLEAARKAL